MDARTGDPAWRQAGDGMSVKKTTVTRDDGTEVTYRGDLLTPAEVGRLFRVDPKTVGLWEKAGKLRAIRTLGGHRRYPESEVRALLNASRQERKG